MDKNTSRFIIAALILSLLVFSGLLYDSYQLAKAIAFISISMAVLLYASFTGKKFAFTLPVMFAGAFYLYMALSLAVSPHKPPVYYALTLLAPAGFFAALALRPEKKHFLAFVNAACAAASLFLFAQLFKNPLARPYSFFGNPIFFAEFIAINFPLLLASLYFFREKKALPAANALLCFFAMLLSGSRGALISFFISSAFFSLYMLRLKPVKPAVLLKNLIFVLIPAVIIASTLFFYPATKAAVKNSLSRAAGIFSVRNRAVTDRILIAKSALAMSMKAPVSGRGAGAFRQLYQEYQSNELAANPAFSFLTTSYAHNDFMQLLSEFGLTGLLLFLLFFISLLRRFDMSSAGLDEPDYVISLALVSSLLCVFTESFFNFPLFILPAAGLFWMYAGLLHGSTGEGRAAPVYLSRALFAAAAVPALLGLILTVKPVYSNFFLKQGVNEVSANSNYEMDYFSRAIELDPSSYYAYFYAGYSLLKKRDYEKSAWHYKRALDIYPASADAIYNIATCLRMSGKPDEAVSYFKKCLAFYPSFSLARLKLGRTYMDMGMEKEGLAEIAAAKKYDPAYADPEMMDNVMEFFEATWEEK